LINRVTVSSPRRALLHGRRTHLITGGAARLQRLGVMPSTVKLTLPIEVDEIHEQLLADATREARRVPAGVGPRARCEHADIATRQALLALQHQTDW